MKNRLRVLRAERSWSRGNLANRLGVSRQTMNDIENGRHDASLPLAFGIARLFGRPIKAICEPAGVGPTSTWRSGAVSRLGWPLTAEIVHFGVLT